MIDLTFLAFIVIGFLAQMIDGSLGMSYGTISVTFLMFIGTPPALASSAVHVSKVMTGSASGLSHWKLGNVDKRLFLKLLISGVVGGIAGATAISLIPDGILRPLIAVYLLLTGLNILRQSFRRVALQPLRVRVMPLGALGGFVDAVGGGWGPIVVSTLLANGQNPQKSIGSVSLAEAFVAAAITVTLSLHISHTDFDWRVIAGLIIGGMIAAPLAAYLTIKLPIRALMSSVGLLVMGLSAVMLISSLV